MKLLKILMVMGVLAFGAGANASVLSLDFSTGGLGAGGSVVYTPESSPSAGDEYVVGTGILIGDLTVEGALADGVDAVYVTNATLSFDTGRDLFDIVGDVTIGSTTHTGLTLFDFNNRVLDWNFYQGGHTGIDVFTAGGLNGIVSNTLLTALGEEEDLLFAFDGFILEASSGNVISTDFVLENRTRGLVPEVPIPAAAWLFGSGLLGLMGVARRKA